MPTIKIALGIALLLSLLAAIGGRQMMRSGMLGPGMMRNTSRHSYAMMSGIPARYSSLRDPLPQSPKTIERGAIVYKVNCAACHGVDGTGDGVAGKNLSPPPADLTRLARTPMVVSDPYLYWTIAEGGAPFGSAMPAYKDALSESDVWSVVVYMRARFFP